MFPPALHAMRWDGPNSPAKVDLGPLRPDDLARARRCQDREFKAASADAVRSRRRSMNAGTSRYGMRLEAVLDWATARTYRHGGSLEGTSREDPAEPA